MEENNGKGSRNILIGMILFGVLLFGFLYVSNTKESVIRDIPHNEISGFVSAQVEEGNLEITRTASTETTCRLVEGRKVCNLILYSGIRFVEEDNQWKKVEDARSLKDKGFNIVYLENDPSFNIIVNDFNMSYFDIDLEFLGNPSDYPECQVTDSLNAKCDFKLDEKWKEFNETTGEVIEKNQLKFQYKWQMKNGVVTKGDKVKFEYKGNPFGRDFSFGGNSTTIKLQEADTENLEDTTVYGGGPDENYGTYAWPNIGTGIGTADWRFLIKFNISSIPSDQQIDESTVFLYMWFAAGDSSTDIGVHHSTNQSWDEMVITWNSALNIYNTTAEETKAVSDTIEWKDWSVTASVKQDYSNNNANTSFVFIDTNEDRGSGSSKRLIAAKEYTTDVTKRAYLNITYSPIPSPPILNLDSPANNTITSTLTHYFNASYTTSMGALVNTTLYIWNSTNDIINQTTESITGTSNSTNISVTFSYDDVYLWNYESCNDIVFCGSADENFTITIDTTPPTFDNLANQISDVNTSFSFDIDATDLNGISCFTVNDTTNFQIDCNGVLQNNTELSVQVYTLNISVNDTANNTAYGIMNVDVSLFDTILKWDWTNLMTDIVAPDKICFIMRNGELCFDDSTFFVDTITARVGIGTTTPQNKLNVVGAVNATTGFIKGANVGLTGNYSIGTCYVAYSGGIMYSTNCTAF